MAGSLRRSNCEIRVESFHFGLKTMAIPLAAADHSPFCACAQLPLKPFLFAIPVTPSWRNLASRLHREAEMDDVRVFNDIIFAFEPKLAGFFAFGFAPMSDKIGVGNDLSADEAPFNVAVDLPG